MGIPNSAVFGAALAGADPNDYSDKYNTKLTPEEEAAYQEWARKVGRSRDTYDYDLRGAWKELQSGTMTEDERGHLGDKYKKPNHPTFSDQSKYSTPETPGGTWTEEGGVVTYTPSAWVVKRFGADNLKRYFDRFEPDVRLNLGDMR